MSRLKTKICIVTGAGRGIGAAIAQAFAREGATVVVTDKNEASAADVAREIGGHHLRLDVASEADWTALAEAWPACDVLVNNAGITGFEEACARTTPSTPRWRIGVPCMRSISTAHFSAAAMRSARCAPGVPGRLSTYPLVPVWWAFRRQRPMRRPRPPCAITPSRSRYTAPNRG